MVRLKKNHLYSYFVWYTLIAVNSPCTGMVTVWPLFAVTVAVAIVTSVCPGTGVVFVSPEECGEACAGLPPSEGLSESTKSRLRAVPATGELYRSHNVGEDEGSKR